MRKLVVCVCVLIVIGTAGFLVVKGGYSPPEALRISTAEAGQEKPWSVEAVNLSLRAVEVTGSASDGLDVAPWAARDGSFVTEWRCSPGFGERLTYDLGERCNVEGFRVAYPSMHGASVDLNPLSYEIQTKRKEGDDWETAFSVINDGTGDQTTLVYAEPEEMRYAALIVAGPARGATTTARIVEFEVWGRSVSEAVPEAGERAEVAQARRRIDLGRTYIDQHEWEAAVGEFDAVLKDPEAGRENHAMALLGQGIVLFDKSEVDEGLGMWRKVMDEYPDCPEAAGLAACRLGQYHLVYLRWEEALGYLGQAMGRYPESEPALWARVHLMDYYTWQGKPEQARQVGNEILRDTSGRATVKMLGWTLAKMALLEDEEEEGAEGDTPGWVVGLEEVWDQFAGVDEDVAMWVKHKVATHYYRHDRYEECAVQLRELLEVYPSTPQWSNGARYMLADTLYRLQRMDEARTELKYLMEEAPGSRAAKAAPALLRIIDNFDRQWAWRLRNRSKGGK